MAKITIEELSGSLREYLNGLGLTEAQVQGLIDKFEDEKIGDISQLSTEEKESLVGAINEVNQKANKEVDLSNYQQKTDNSLQTSSKNLVGAINELFQNANNGKQLIASAIGEPLSSSDTFSAMSNDINGLLSQFKTNMMNNGVTVESGDRFKQLIDKIATLANNEVKGIQFAEGTFTANKSNLYDNKEVTINYSPGFIPTYVFVNFKEIIEGYDNGYIKNVLVSNLNTSEIPSGVYSFSLFLSNITESSFKINCEGYYNVYDNKGGSWYAIGVGEEDTTLRDSLASILEGKGVEVSEEDDMVSLITKVDGLKICYMGPGTEVLFYQASDLNINAEQGTYTRNITIPEYPLNFAGMTLSFTHSSKWSWTSNGYDFSVVHERNNEVLNTIDTFSSQESKDATKSYNLSVDDDYRVGDVIKITMVNNHGSESILEYIKLTFNIL